MLKDAFASRISKNLNLKNRKQKCVWKLLSNDFDRQFLQVT